LQNGTTQQDQETEQQIFEAAHAYPPGQTCSGRRDLGMNQMADEPESSGSVQWDDPSSAGGFFNLTPTCAIEEHHLY